MFGRTFPASAHSVSFLHSRHAQRRIFPHSFAGTNAEHAGTLDQQQIGAGNADAAGEADHQQPRAPIDTADAVLEDLAADGIEHHIGATAVGDALDRVAKRLAAVEHQMIGALLFGNRQLLFRRCRRDHDSAKQLADLDRRQAHATAGAVHQQHFAGKKLPAIDQRVIGGAVRGEECRALSVIERRWQRRQLRRRDDRFIGIGAMAQFQDDLVADRGRRSRP